MKYDDKIQVAAIFIAPPDLAAEGDRLLKSHAAWMESTHYRSGEKALLSFNWSKAPELSDPMDINSAPTGNMCFVLTEIYESKAGIVDHWEQTRGSWGDFPAALKWMEKCKVTGPQLPSLPRSGEGSGFTEAKPRGLRPTGAATSEPARPKPGCAFWSRFLSVNSLHC